MPKVFVTQLPHRRDHSTGQLVPAFNINTAQEHGELVMMMPAQAHYQPTNQLVAHCAEAVRGYDYEEGDSLLLLGDTAIIASTVAVLARKHRRITVLRWDRLLSRYTRVVITT